MDLSERILKIIDQTYKENDTSYSSIKRILINAIRIAKLRNDSYNLWWLNLETKSTRDISNFQNNITESVPFEFIKQITTEHFKKRFSIVQNKYIDERSVNIYDFESKGFKENIIMISAGELVSKIENIKQSIEDLTVPTNLHTLDAYYKTKENDKLRNIFATSIDQYIAVIERIKIRAINYISDTENSIVTSKVQVDIFNENKNFIEIELQNLDKELINQFNSSFAGDEPA